jgi:alpha-L-rhamnosidase
MKIVFAVLAFSLLLLSNCKEGNVKSFSVSETRCNGMQNPEGIGEVPEFSWIISSSLRGQEQKAYQLIVSSGPELINKDKGDIWDSGKTISSTSTWIRYTGPQLHSGKRYFWKVRVWDRNDKPSAWSKKGEFLTALFNSSDWSSAKWIGFEEIPDSLLLVPGVHGSGDYLGNIAKKRTTVPLFRKEFSLNKKISHAYVFVSGLGQYELFINGSKIGDRFLSPGWTDYRKRCLYNTFDVTEKLISGRNVIGTIAGNGFYNINSATESL